MECADASRSTEPSDPAARRDVQYEGCFSGPAGINGWLGGVVGFIAGMFVLTIAASAVPEASVPALGVVLLVGCTALGAVFLRMRRFAVRLRGDRLDILIGRRVRSLAYDQIVFVDAHARIDTFWGGEWPNVRVRLRDLEGGSTRIGLNRSAGESLVAELRCRCARAGGLDRDGAAWLPDEPTSRGAARARLRTALFVDVVLGVVVATACVAGSVTVLLLVAWGPRSGTGAPQWSKVFFASTGLPLAVRSLLRAARAWRSRAAA